MHRLVVSCVWISACLVLTAVASGQEGGPSAEEMQKYMELAQPGPHHKMLAEGAGTWETKTTMWMQPGAPPVESTGTSTITAVLGGRFVEEVTQSNMMGMPWEGRGTFGYDNVSKKHIATWYDSFGTMIMSFEGGCDGKCNVVSMTSNYFDPVSKSNKTMKVVSKRTDKDHYVTEMYDVDDGKDTKTAEVQYTRVEK